MGQKMKKVVSQTQEVEVDGKTSLKELGSQGGLVICSLMQALQPQEISANHRRSAAASVQNSGLHKSERSRKTVRHSGCLSRADPATPLRCSVLQSSRFAR